MTTGSVIDSLGAALTEALGRPVSTQVPLARFTTYRLGGPAALFVEVGKVRELDEVARVTAAHRVPVLVVGRGSNLLVTDDGYRGLAIRLTGEFERLEADGTGGAVTAGGALALPDLARQTADEGLAGLEFFVGIPGSVGGAVRMNAGGHGHETAEVLDRAWTVDLSVGPGERARNPEQLALGYRRSSVGPDEVVTRARFRVGVDTTEACRERIAEVVRWRREHQPGGSNAGSVFTNPPGDSAGRLIDACGLKGFRVGGARVSEKHANFFQASRSATADDVYRLIREVQRRVEEATGVHLVPELTAVGFEEEAS